MLSQNCIYKEYGPLRTVEQVISRPRKKSDVVLAIYTGKMMFDS